MRLRLFCSLALLALAPGRASAQRPLPLPPVLVPADSGIQQRILLRDGSELIGRILSVGDSTVQFQSTLGVITIRSENIIKLASERGGKYQNGQYYFPNPNATRLIFAPTARMLKKGEGYFSDYWIFFPGISVGLSDFVTLGGGMSIFPEAETQVMYFTPKVGIVQSPKVNFAVGALMAAVPFDGDANSAGILYGVGTWGEVDASFTAGLGYGYTNGKLASNPAVLLGAESRISPRVSFVTENYLLPGGIVILGGGLRFMGRGMAFDLALTSFNGDGENFCCLPFVGFVYNFR